MYSTSIMLYSGQFISFPDSRNRVLFVPALPRPKPICPRRSKPSRLQQHTSGWFELDQNAWRSRPDVCALRIGCVNLKENSRFGKPIILSGFGLVTQDNAPSFVPFNSTVAPFANDQIGELLAVRAAAYANQSQGILPSARHKCPLV